MTPAQDTASPSDAIPRGKYLRSLAIRVGGSALLLTLLIFWLPTRQLGAALKRIPPGLGLGLLCVYLALHLLGITKWRLLINLAGANLTFFQALRCYYLGLFGNIFLPSLIGGDFVRAGLAFRLSRSRSAIVLGSLIDRMQDVAGLLVVAATGALMVPGSLDPRYRRVFIGVGAILAIGGVIGVGSLFVIPVRRFPFKIRRILVRLRRGIWSMYRRPARVLLAFCLGICLQVCLIAINYRLGETVGLSIPFHLWLFSWPLAKLSSLLPVSQGGIGLREVAMVSLLSPFGVPAVLTAAVTLVFDAMVTCGGLIAGLISFLAGRASDPAASPAPQTAS